MKAKHGAVNGIEYFWFPRNKKTTMNDLLETNQRFDQLKSSNNLIFMKIFPYHLTNDLFNYLNDNYLFICLDRFNKLDQFISFNLSRSTNAWAALSLEQVDEHMQSLKKIRIDPRGFHLYFKKEIGTYYFLCNYIKNTYAKFTYENLILQQPRDVLLNLFPDDGELIQELDLQLTYRMNPRNKLKYVNNADEIMQLFRNPEYVSRINEQELFDKKIRYI